MCFWHNDIANQRKSIRFVHFPIPGHFDAMPLFAEGNFEQFANGSFIIHDQYVSHFGFLPSEAFASRDAGQLYRKFRATIFFGDHADPPAVSLDDLVNDGETKACSTDECGLEWFQIFSRSAWVKSSPSGLETGCAPKRARTSSETVNTPPLGMGAQRIVG